MTLAATVGRLRKGPGEQGGFGGSSSKRLLEVSGFEVSSKSWTRSSDESAVSWTTVQVLQADARPTRIVRFEHGDSLTLVR
jgi:hypothetical protein